HDFDQRTADKRVLAWGYNGFGQLGSGTTKSSKTPLEVERLRGSNITRVACGTSYTMALTGKPPFLLFFFFSSISRFCSGKGKVFVWGDNDHGKLGTNSTQNETVPVELTALNEHHITSIACGDDHSLALTGLIFWMRKLE